MKEIRYSTLGETWLAAVSKVLRDGQAVDGESLEVLNLLATFERGEFLSDPILVRFASEQSAREMHKVFFTTEPNQFGHSYRDRLRGPRGRDDLGDVIELLAAEPRSKRALVSLDGSGDGRVPCINAIHFLHRGHGLVVTYFARGQDLFRKYYADGACIFEMGVRVARALEVPLLSVSGLISSAHVYLKDLEDIRAVLADAESLYPQTPALPEAQA
jgi:thymidylate synthase